MSSWRESRLLGRRKWTKYVVVGFPFDKCRWLYCIALSWRYPCAPWHLCLSGETDLACCNFFLDGNDVNYYGSYSSYSSSSFFFPDVPDGRDGICEEICDSNNKWSLLLALSLDLSTRYHMSCRFFKLHLATALLSPVPVLGPLLVWWCFWACLWIFQPHIDYGVMYDCILEMTDWLFLRCFDCLICL